MTGGHTTEIADLEKLAGQIDSAAYATRLVAAEGRKPRLRVANRAAAVLAENVYAEEGSYWWPWADRIGEASDPAEAAQVVMRVLRSANLPAAPR